MARRAHLRRPHARPVGRTAGHTSRDRDGLITARLDRTALRLTDDHVARETAVAERREITTVGSTVRVDLLTETAGSLLGRHLRDPQSDRTRHAALLLVHAGADRDGAKEHARTVLARLPDAIDGGIGSPGRAQALAACSGGTYASAIPHAVSVEMNRQTHQQAVDSRRAATVGPPPSYPDRSLRDRPEYGGQGSSCGLPTSGIRFVPVFLRAPQSAGTALGEISGDDPALCRARTNVTLSAPTCGNTAATTPPLSGQSVKAGTRHARVIRSIRGLLPLT